MTSRTDPAAAAAAVYRAHAGDRDWLDAFSACLDRHRAGQALSRILAAWGLSQAEAARLFGVTRQALAKLGRPARAVTVFPDSGHRYLSTIYNDAWLASKGCAA